LVKGFWHHSSGFATTAFKKKPAFVDGQSAGPRGFPIRDTAHCAAEPQPKRIAGILPAAASDPVAREFVTSRFAPGTRCGLRGPVRKIRAARDDLDRYG